MNRLRPSRAVPVLLAGLLGLLASPAVARQAAESEPATPAAMGPRSEVARAVDLLDRLDGTVISVDYEAQPALRIVDELVRRHELPLAVDWESLARLDATPRTEVTLRLDRVSALSVLTALAVELGDRFEAPHVEAFADRVIITTHRGSEPLRLTEAYDVRDLLARPGALDPIRPRPQPRDPLDDEDEGDDGDGTDTDLEPVAPLSPGVVLLEMVLEHVDPEAWRRWGGSRALATERDGMLLVTAGASVHRAVQRTLDALRRGTPDGLQLRAWLVELPAEGLASVERRFPAGKAILARRVLATDGARVLWSQAAPVRLGSESASTWTAPGGATSLELRVLPTLAAETSLLSLDVSLDWTDDAGRTTLATGATLAFRAGAATIVLPHGEGAAMRRVLLLVPER